MGTAPQSGVRRLTIGAAEVVVFPAPAQLFEAAAAVRLQVVGGVANGVVHILRRAGARP